MCLMVVKLAGAWSVRTRLSSSRKVTSSTQCNAWRVGRRSFTSGLSQNGAGGIVNLYGWGRADPASRAGHTEGHAIRATPVTLAQVWKAWARAARYWAAGR